MNTFETNKLMTILLEANSKGKININVNKHTHSHVLMNFASDSLTPFIVTSTRFINE